MAVAFDLDRVIRKIPDFPRPGILFYDVTGILTEPEAFRSCVEEMERLYAAVDLDAVAAVEARGFLFASPFAHLRYAPTIFPGLLRQMTP